MVLPFGVRSAPYIFTCIADLVEWMAKRNNDVTFLMHYLDDFHTLGSPGSSYSQWDPLPDFEVSSDASGVLGYGAVFQGHWFSGSQSIDYKEIFPIVLAAYLWGPLWASKRVNFLSDNHSVVEILRSAFQEPLPSCPWFAICPCWQLVTPSLSLCPQ
ncbi:unnamed protein product [Porites evermanni]|uniref:Reverse transcriptase n=1 Tax=Porites evermanni TaxID=104178 RepID=A0ABN8LFH2_9CNID|nr:unnamed protein product [Porites evermanni]